MRSKGFFYHIKKVQGIKYVSLEFDGNIRNSTIGCKESKVICDAFKLARKRNLPVVAFIVSAGIRVTEGTMALMQMVKLTLAVKQHSKRGLLYIAIVGNPTLGGASASFVSLADIIIAKTDSVFGFSGKRIVRGTTLEQLPTDFQTAQYAKKYGMVDIVLDEEEIEDMVFKLLQLHKIRGVY